MRLWQFSNPYGIEFPQGYKFSWIAYNVKILKKNIRENRFIDILNDREGFFEWVSVDETEKLFLAKIRERFGHFDLNM
ncbi:MAG: hypothetical protein MRERC_10c037 [Mycoplasmataceae bacterium RC_NB112A]|nr:MAG: hypothetical protein MRERC_10c037 [Mycoplasmataceae bacterium RC_NB112A]